MEASLRSSATASLPWAISSNLARRRFTSIRRRQFSILARVPGRAQSTATINCVDYLRGPKEIDKKLMCSETPTAGTQPAIYASEAGSSELNVEELKVKSNAMGPNY